MTGRDKIDVFCHIFPKRLVKSLTPSQLPSILSMGQNSNFVDPGYRVRVMDKYGIEMEALTVSLPSFWEKIPKKDRRRLTKLSNDTLAEITDEFPDRLIPIASTPDPADPNALDELDRAVNELGMRGCMVFSNVDGKPLDSPDFDPFFTRIEKYNLPVLLHPITQQYFPWIREYNLTQIFGWPFDTSLAMARIVFGGVLERHPNLKIIAHHVGAMIPHFSERIRGMYDLSAKIGKDFSGQVLGKSLLQKHPLHYFKMFYADTVTNGGLSSLRCGYEFYGANRILFATDYPFGPERGERWTRLVEENVEDLGITKDEKEAIFHENARKLLRLD
jgi:aminocarboxymuconate-semialdehyde decarboxylase